MRTLKPYQKIVLDQIKDRDKVALYLQMRLGKTVISVKWFKHRNIKRCMILAPKAVIPGWLRELKEEGYRRKRIHIIDGTINQKYNDMKQKLFGFPHFYLTNYETITHCPAVLKLGWDCIVVDESTKIKNPKADVTKYLIANAEQVKLKLELSGLPNPESEIDFVEQMRFLEKGFMGTKNFWEWRGKYCYQGRFKWELRSGTYKKLLEAVKRNAVFLSRKDAGVGEEKVYEKRYVYMNAKQEKAYKEMMKDFETQLKKELITTKFVGAKYEFLSQIASGVTPKGKVFSEAKFKEMIYLLTGDLKRESVVVWFRHNHELYAAEKYLKKRKITYGVFTGERKEKEKEFKSGKVRVMLAQPKCAQFGMNWFVSSSAIYFSCPWGNEVRQQTEDRLIEISKKDSYLYVDLICKGTIDEDVYKVSKEKKTNSESFLRALTVCIKERLKKCSRV